MTGTPRHQANPYVELTDEQYAAVLNAQYVKSPYSNGNGGCISMAVGPDGLIGLQDDKLEGDERQRRTQVFTREEVRAFIAGAKAGAFDHLA